MGTGRSGATWPHPLTDTETRSLINELSDDIQKKLEKAKLVQRFEELLKLPSDNDLRVVFLDVGQGNCTVVKLPDGRIMVIDCNTDSANDNVINFLKKAGISQIDVLVATHPDQDHISGLARLAKMFSIKELWKVAFQKTEENASQESVEAYADY